MNFAFNDLYSIMKYQECNNSGKDQYTAFTYVKFDETKEQFIKKTTDYLFMAKNKYLEKKGVVIEEFMDPVDLSRYSLLNLKDGYPYYDHPSDHFSVAYKVFLK